MHYIKGALTLGVITLLQTQFTNAQTACAVVISTTGQNIIKARACVATTPNCFLTVKTCRDSFPSCIISPDLGTAVNISCGSATDVSDLAECMVRDNTGFSCPI